MMILFVTFSVAIMAGCVGYRLGHIAGRCDENMAALVAGVGDWERDPEDGIYRFRYGVRPTSNHPPGPDDEQSPWA